MEILIKYSKEWWAERLSIIQAFAEGKTIQYHCDCNGRWYDSRPDSTLQLDNPIYEYRLKPEPIYKPYPGLTSFVCDMAKHGNKIEYLRLDGSTQWRTSTITSINQQGIWLSEFGFASYTDLINYVDIGFRWSDDATKCGIEVTV